MPVAAQSRGMGLLSAKIAAISPIGFGPGSPLLHDLLMITNYRGSVHVGSRRQDRLNRQRRKHVKGQSSQLRKPLIRRA